MLLYFSGAFSESFGPLGNFKYIKLAVMDEPSSKNDKITPFQKIEVEESSDEEIDDVIDPDVTVTPAGEVGLILKK